MSLGLIGSYPWYRDGAYGTQLVARSRDEEAVQAAAKRHAATPVQVALAWLLKRSPNILLIPGTSSAEHLRENLKAATLQLPSEVIAKLDTIGGGTKS